MDSTQQSELLASLAETLEALVASRIGLSEASRKISAARHALHQEQNPLFLPFVGIDSETDKFPLGPVRERWATEALERYDREREATELHYKSFATRSAVPLLEWIRSHAF